MNLFKSMTLTWWQISLFKLGMLALGVLIGAYLRDVLALALPIIAVIAAACLIYISYIWIRQPAQA